MIAKREDHFSSKTLLMSWALEVKNKHGIEQPARANLILGSSLWETYR
jgi:hypothetical protein